MIQSRKLLLGLASLLTVGCATHLETRRLDAAGEARQGIGYALPYTVFHIKATWRLVSCDTKATVSQKVEFTRANADDGNHAYLLDPASLQTLLSTGALTVKYHEGTNSLASINASLEDRSSAVVGAIATGFGKLLSVAAAAGASGQAPKACTKATIDALDKIKTQKVELERLTSILDGAKQRLKVVTDRADAMGDRISERTRLALDRAIKEVGEAQAAVTAQAESLSDAMKPFTYIVEEIWPRDSKELDRATPLELPEAVLQKWIGKDTVSLNDDELVALLDKARVYVGIRRLGSFARAFPAAPASTGAPGAPRPGPPTPTAPAGPAGAEVYSDPPDSVLGIRYRMPAQGEIIACRAPCASSTDVIARSSAMIAQLGFVNVLPVSARAFGSTTFSAEFTADGALKSVGYEQKTAPGEQLSAAFGKGVEGAAPLLTWDQTREEARQKRELARLEFLTKQRDALAGLAADPNADTRLAAAEFEADAALARAEISSIEAQMALALARARQGN